MDVAIFLNYDTKTISEGVFSVDDFDSESISTEWDASIGVECQWNRVETRKDTIPGSYGEIHGGFLGQKFLKF